MSRTVFILFVLAAVSSLVSAAEPRASTAPQYRYTHSRKADHLVARQAVHRDASKRRDSTLHRNAGRKLKSHRAADPRTPAHRSPNRTDSAFSRARREPAPRLHTSKNVEKDAIEPAHPAPQRVSLTRRHVPMPAPLTGTLASLERQNERTDAEGLERILDDDDLNDRIAAHLLVRVPVSSALAINPDLSANRRYCRPWTARFLKDLARDHAVRFHTPLQVSSAVRTVAYQKRLMRVNGNAAPAEGDIVSPHITGATIDIAKSGLSAPEIAWMRTRLRALQIAGQLDAEEEFQQACFHITVYKSYIPATPKSPRRRSLPAVELASRGR